MSFALVTAVIPAFVLTPTGASAATTTAAKKVTERPDEYSAMVAARSQGAPVAITSSRTPTTVTYANPDGSLTQNSYSGVAFTQKADGAWTDVDTTLTSSGGVVSPAAVPVDVRLSAGGASGSVLASVGAKPGSLVAPGAAAGSSFSVAWPSALPVPTLSGDTATYANVSPGVDLQVRALAGGFETFIVLTRKPATVPSFTMPFATKGLGLSAGPAGQLVLTTAGGKRVASSGSPTMWDATGDPRAGDPGAEQQVPVTVGANALVVSPTAAFLNDPATVYPVTIDPTGTILDSYDTYLDKFHPTTNYASTNTLYAGTSDTGTHVYRGLMYFDSHGVTGTTVISAALHVYQYNSLSCTPSNVEVRRLTSMFSDTTATWNSPPVINSTVYASANEAHGFSASCPAAWLGGSTGLPITSLVSAWASGSVPNDGIALQATSETSGTSFKGIYSDEVTTAAYRPYISVTFDHSPTLTGIYISPFKSGYTNTATPTFRIGMTDPDAGTVSAHVQVTNDAVNSQIWAGDTPAVASPGAGSIAVPAGTPLPVGVPLRVRVQLNDGMGSTGWSSTIPLTIDTTTPGAPTVSSSAYNLTAGAWTSPAPTSNTFTLSQPSGTTDVTSFLYSEDGGAWTSLPATSGTAALPWVASQGVHTLAVSAVDRANNVSAKTTTSFNVGNGALLSPSPNSRAQAYVPLTADGPSTRTHIIRYEYQQGTQGTWTTVPGADLYTPGTTTNPTYPLARTAGSFPALDWNLAHTITTAGGADGLVQIRTCLGTSATDASPVCSLAVPVTLDATALDGSYATSPLGPGTVSLTTGDFSTSDTDASFGGLTVSRSLTTLAPSTASGSAGVFGPGWVASLPAPAGASDLVLADHLAQGYATLTGADGSQSTYATTSSTLPATLTGVGESADGSVLTKVSANSYTLTDTDGTVTTWTLAGTAWQASAVVRPGNESTTSFTYDSFNRVTRILAPAPTSVACSTTGTLVIGCRALTISYAPATTATGTTEATWGNVAGQVSSISYTNYDPATSTMVTTPVSSYLYDTTGHLRAQWDPRITPALKTTYDYTGTRLTALTPPGLNGWTLHYDSANRVIDAQRTDPANGPATTAVVYGIPISGTGAPIDFGAGGANDPASWGHTTDLPRGGSAIFPASHTPSKDAKNDDYAPAATDWPYADLSYQDINGRTVETATYGANEWLISSQEYNENGDVVWALGATARAEALAPTAGAGDYVRGLSTSPARAAALATTYTYSGDGSLLASLGPVHDVLTAGNTRVLVPVRVTTTNTFDEGAPPGGPYRLVTTTVSSPTPVDGSLVAAADIKITKTSYDPIDGSSNTGLTSGWVLRSPTKTTVVMGTTVGGSSGASDLVDAVLYDSSGRVVQERQPSDPDGTRAGTRSTTYYSAAANAVFPECGAHPEWAGMVCRTGPAAQPTGVTAPTTVTKYDRYDLPVSVVEVSGTTTRTTTNSYDGAGRFSTTNVSDNIATDVAVPKQAVDYDPATGAPIRARSVTPGGVTDATVATSYDAMGRVVGQDDGYGNLATSTYTIDSQLRSVTNPQGSTSYGYDGTGEHRGLVTSIDAGIGSGVPSMITATYNRGGTPTTTYPNGVVVGRLVDAAGTLRSLTYTDSSGTKFAEWDQAFNAYGQVVTSDGPASAGGRSLTYSYDPAGRLVSAKDSISDRCIVRSYVLDVDSNRLAQDTWVGAEQAACPTSAATSASASSRTSSYDSFDRVIATTVAGTGAGTATYGYDALGRSTSVPLIDIGGSVPVAANLTYFANDLTAVANQVGGTRRTLGIDPLSRLSTWTDSTGGTSTTTKNHYDDAGDSPSWTSVDDGTTKRTSRNILGPDGNLALTTDQSGSGVVAASLSIVDPHGDVFTSLPDVANVAATLVGANADTDEFGVSIVPPLANYGWVGADRRVTDTADGLIQMGVRLYNPIVGRFLSVDPVYGGNANRYCYPADPVNGFDLSGQMTGGGGLSLAGPAGGAFGAVADAVAKTVFIASAGYFFVAVSYSVYEKAKDQADARNAGRSYAKKARASDKEASTDVPSWAKGKVGSYLGGDAGAAATKIFEEQYGRPPTKKERGPRGEWGKIKKALTRKR